MPLGSGLDFSLTPALSRWERERLFYFAFLVAVRAQDIVNTFSAEQ